MKLLYLEHIIETILEDVPCPRCKALLEDTLIDIQNISDKRVEIFAPCTNCGSPISIHAEIEEQSSDTILKVIFPEKITTRKLSPENIQNIVHSIENFKDRDIRKLF